MSSTTMRVARVARSGATAIDVATVPIPSPGPGQLLIRVEAAGVNFSDVKRRRGDLYPFPTAFPYIPGSEVAGTIVAHGEGVSAPPVGTRVFALAGADGAGGYAQFALAYANTAIPIPPMLSPAQASTILVAGATAMLLLRDVAQLRAGERVLVTSGAGGVGSFAVQIARALGAAQVIATVGRRDKVASVEALGAHHVIVTEDDDWAASARAHADGAGVDVALEANGGAFTTQTLRSLAPFGRLIVYGAASGVSGQIDDATLATWLYAPALNQSVTAFNLGVWFQGRPEAAGAALGALIGLIASGDIRVPEVMVLPLERASEAHARLESRGTRGKFALDPWA